MHWLREEKNLNYGNEQKLKNGEQFSFLINMTLWGFLKFRSMQGTGQRSMFLTQLGWFLNSGILGEKLSILDEEHPILHKNFSFRAKEAFPSLHFNVL